MRGSGRPGVDSLPSDHEIALAFIARRQASRAMTASRWSHFLSLEMGWMNPGQARVFVDAAVRAGLLAPDGEALRLVIDPQAVEVPRGFRPKADAPASAPSPAKPSPVSFASGVPVSTGPAATPPATPEADPFLAWVARLAADRRGTREQVLGQVAQLQEEMGGLLTAEAAVLLLARRSGMDVREAATAAAAAMVRPRRPGTAPPAPAGNR